MADDLRGTQGNVPPAGGWGALNAVEKHLNRQGILISGNRTLLSMNKPGGFDCPSCAWPDPTHPHVFEYCENGARAVAWESTRKRATPEFFAEHTVTELSRWSDHDLEDVGRLTHPMAYDAASDKYVPVSWEDAFRRIGAELRGLGSPWQLELYTSGRASNEAAFLYQLFGRMYGMNNFPDCSNMRHETTTVALPESIGVGKGTVSLDDFDMADAIFIFGQNPGTNSPRMMSDLHDAARRGVPIVTFNPLREHALVKFASPQSAVEMVTRSGVRISSQYHQVRIGGDMAAVQGMCKAVIAADDRARAEGRPRVLDVDFLHEHTAGSEAFAEYCRALPWERIERYSGLPRAEIEAAAEVYMSAKRVIACWGMGVTQHKRGGDTMQQIANLLLLRGNIGKCGAGACPIRGHSNVQGDRSVGIYQKPKAPFLDPLGEVFGFAPPREGGHDVAECCEAILRGEVEAWVGIGGNFFRAIPDTERVEPAVRGLRMTVMINTKPNRSITVHGRKAFLLPCLGRTETDIRNGVKQTVTVEDSMSMVHGSRGILPPASDELISEIAIVAGIAKATLAPNPRVDWDAMADDYALIRDRIAEVLPEQFHDYNRRIAEPGGFRLPNAARERRWDTPNGKANFLFPGETLEEDDTRPDDDHLQMMTIRSHDQFNTTVYSLNGRYRDIHGERMVVMLNRDDMRRLELREGDVVELRTVSPDGIDRRMSGFRAIPFDVPPGCCAAYYPETNPLLPLANRDQRSNTPAAKSVPVTVARVQAGDPVGHECDVEQNGPTRDLHPDQTTPQA